MSQNEEILKDLKQGQRITPLDALKNYGCFRLGARIWDLKQQGHKIKSVLVKTESGKYVSRYFLEK